jgi:hypothetical protein
MKGLFINQPKNQCSIFESGLMIYKALKNSFNIEYREVEPLHMNDDIYEGFDYYIFNWHHNTLPISSSTIKKIRGLKIAILLEVGPTTMRPFMPEDMFDAYMVMDPTKETLGKYFVFPRPLEKVTELLPLLTEDIPVFGTFGFIVPGKNFGEVLKVANDTRIDCIVRMNFPHAVFTGIPFSYVKEYSQRLHLFKSNTVDLRITHDYMTKEELIPWCSQNSLNVFPYYRDLPGLSAVTDQAIVAGRGIAITDCNTFRHMHKYINYYPKESYLELTTSTLPGIKKMQEDWSNEKFVNTFKDMLSEMI